MGRFKRAFVLPKSSSKWTARVKNNVYYYRTNYALIFILSWVICFLRNPPALASVVITAAGLLCLNDPFATAVNDQLLRIIKKLHPRTALRLRALAGPNDGNLGSLRSHKHRGKQRLHILWLPRNLLVFITLGMGLLLMWRSAALLTIAWGVLLGLGLPLLHATFRSPNLKARLASAREEFRAVWRGYQAGLQNDYTQ